MGVYNRNEKHPERPANWWIVYQVDGKRVREKGCGRNKQATERLLAKRLREVEAGTWKPSKARADKLTVTQYAARWVVTRQAEGVLTWRDYEARLRDHVLPVIGEMELAKVRRADVKALVAGIVAGGKLSPRSVIHVYDALRSMYSRAVEDEIVVATPCTLKVRRGELPAKKDADARWRHTAIYATHEIEALISDARVPWNRRVFYGLLFLTGARFGEAAGRQWLDWDRSARPLGRLTIATQYEGRELKSPTGSAPVRHIPVHPALASLLSEWERVGFALTYGRDPRESDWIVPSLQGMGLRTLRNGLKRLAYDCKTLGFRARTQHDARRTFSTLMREHGADRDLVGALTHGASTHATLDHYLVWRWPTLCEAVSRLPIAVGSATLLPHLVKETAETPGFPGVPQRGGRDSNERPTKKRGETESNADRLAPKSAADSSLGGVTHAHPDTPRVPIVGAGDRGAKLLAAADALRSGRVDRLTAEWREELAEACEEAAAEVARAESEVG